MDLIDVRSLVKDEIHSSVEEKIALANRGGGLRLRSKLMEVMMTQRNLYRSIKGLNFFLKNALGVKPQSEAKTVKLNTPWYI